jgi:hypothetical protein
MSRLELQPQNNEEKNHWKLTSDGELAEPIPLTQNFEKTKNTPTLRHRLEYVYRNSSQEEKALLNDLETRCTNFISLNEGLVEARRSYLGCRLAFDGVIYGLPSAMMLADILGNKVSGDTLAVGVVTTILTISMVKYGLISRLMGEKPEPLWDEVKDRKLSLEKHVNALARESNLISANLSLLGLEESLELKEQYRITEVVDEISKFFVDKKEEEESKKEVRRQAGLDN